MRISDVTTEKLLVRSGVATAEQISVLKNEAIRLKYPLKDIAIKNEIIDDRTLTKAFADYTQIPYVEIPVNELKYDIISKIPEHIARQYKAVLFNIDESNTNYLAMEDPDDIQAINFIEKEIGNNTKIFIAPIDNINEALEVYGHDVSQRLDEVIDTQKTDSSDIALQNISEELSEDSPIAKTVTLILEYAIRLNASDVHIEPRENHVQIRYRIDGMLKEANQLPISVMSGLVSRIKILSNLKIDEHRIPQDGRFKINIGDKQYALRVSTLPIADGEKIAMRILDESNKAISLEQLGFWGKSLNDIKTAITEPNGMVLVTGPTGSGKSTSLFSILTILNNPHVNISTIEDPVEYKIPGVNQTQTNNKAGITFANGLRALLRQDPNIIMIGEIRDSETADLSVQAALTGHLVFSTLHTNDAATSLPRLLDMGIEPFLIASTARIVVGQRLVRRINPKTRQSFEPSEEEKQLVIKMFNLQANQDFSYIHELEKRAASEGVGGDTPLATDESGILRLWRADPNDNDNGANNGYIGRTGIYETLKNSQNIQRLIIANATSAQIKEQAIAEGMISLQTDGLIKMLRGETTLEELIRVTRE